MKDRAAYSDAELYRLFVARQLLDGVAACKAEVDAWVRQLGDIETADKFIAYRNKRPGCIAMDWGDEFTCACGAKWAADDATPPACRKERLT